MRCNLESCASRDGGSEFRTLGRFERPPSSVTTKDFPCLLMSHKQPLRPPLAFVVFHPFHTLVKLHHTTSDLTWPSSDSPAKGQIRRRLKLPSTALQAPASTTKSRLDLSAPSPAYAIKYQAFIRSKRSGYTNQNNFSKIPSAPYHIKKITPSQQYLQWPCLPTSRLPKPLPTSSTVMSQPDNFTTRPHLSPSSRPRTLMSYSTH